ncbi:MAG: hypothetical protein IBJ03_07965 [Gemmatimonadaceae bacterium]|nr:hypothetical protein [Gemmatimonadaceae bacterium]
MLHSLRAIVSHRGFVRAAAGGVLLLAVAVVPSSVRAQTPEQRAAALKTAQDAMARFAWLEGEWEGPATAINGGRSFTLTQRESVQRAAMNTALMIQGRGSMRMAPDQPERLVFNAAGMFAYDGITNKYTFFSASGSGQAQQFTAELTGTDGFIWGHSSPDGHRTRYTITRTPAGEWHEIGHTSADDGKTWTRMFEMTLKKKP